MENVLPQIDKKLLIAYSDYHEGATGFARQMQAILPHLRKKYHVVEFGVGAKPSEAMAAMQRREILIPTCEENGKSVNGDYYGQGVMNDLLSQGGQFPGMNECVVLCNHDIQAMQALHPVLRAKNVPLVHWVLIDNDPLHPLLLQALAGPDKLIYQTEYGRSVVANAVPWLDGPVVYPAVDMTTMVEMSTQKLKTLFGPKFWKMIEGKQVVLFVGKNQARKNIAALLDAWGIIQQKSPKAADMVLLIHAQAMKKTVGPRDVGGASDDTMDLRAYMYGHGVSEENVVISHNILKDEVLASFYKLANCVVIPSCSEGFGMPWLEAFHFGKPCIGVDYSATSEVLRGRGYLIEPQSVVYHPALGVHWAYVDPQELADAIITTLANPDMCKSWIEAGKTFLREHTAYQQAELIAKVLDDVYEHREAYTHRLPVQAVI